MANEPFQIRKGDRRPSLAATLTLASDGSAISLSGCTVAFALHNQDRSLVFSLPAVIVDASAGEVRYDWGAGDTANAGGFLGLFVITYGDGTTQTVPTSGYIPVSVVE